MSDEEKTIGGIILPNSDDNVTKEITLRQSMWDDLRTLFTLIREHTPVGHVMSEQDCFMMLLNAAVPYLTKQMREQIAAMSERAAGENVGVSELSFVGTDDLVNELAKRFSQLLIAGEVRSHDKLNHTRLQLFGSKIAAIGLAEFARTSIIDALNKGDSGH